MVEVIEANNFAETPAPWRIVPDHVTESSRGRTGTGADFVLCDSNLDGCIAEVALRDHARVKRLIMERQNIRYGLYYSGRGWIGRDAVEFSVAEDLRL